ncbi:MAG: hypothetical protein GTO45_41070 [Candidatus Aminicenantes bacterium]|nr:hypothetical protein [Candidatus Aminicenantes bacterium]NIM84997.1 hypothetical protein [Candidatus Aminicenantes bacterium]NIN24511.1 hypothetical protein [Candidatus Aminicenantes bacterium]NIN48275.1 hypothetical protein [Candidatus Aminicenantes bacterium]NIN91178.1 hypothetical protein [Candidatus Aminicenantes bacterium]
MEMEKIVANLVQKVERRFYGKYRGFVVDNTDPENLGRLKVTVPSVLGKEIAVWAFPCFPYGGDANQGFLFIPEKEAGVWVEFEEGDTEFPIWVGTFWSKPGGESELPKPNNAEGEEEGSVQDPPTRKIIKTLKGHTIQFEDADGDDRIIICDGDSENRMTFDANGISVVNKENSITMTDDGIIVKDKNSNTLTKDGSGVIIEDTNGNKINMAQSGVTVEDANGNQVLMESGGVTIKSSGEIKIGGNAAESLVKGDTLNTILTNLITMLNTHQHTGNMGAPTPILVPFIAAQFDLKLNNALSLKNKVE